MNIFIYSDESGVLDKCHNQYYVFGGVIFTSKNDKDNYARKFLAVERNIRISEEIEDGAEVKAATISPKSKNKMYRSLRKVERFGVVVSQAKLSSELFSNKKTKQRYLDWVYKITVKKKLEKMISDGLIDPKNVESIYFMVDEHSTATDGRYELRESLEKELKIGMWNFDCMYHWPPLFPNMESIHLKYCNSAKVTLVRAADIVANHIYYLANKNNGVVPEEDNLNIYCHP